MWRKIKWQIKDWILGVKKTLHYRKLRLVKQYCSVRWLTMGTPLSNYCTICHVIYNSYLEDIPMGNCLTLQYYSTFPQMCQLKAHNSGSGRVFSRSRIWPKLRCGIWENSKYLEGKGIWLLLGKRDTLEFGHRMWDFLVCLSGIRDIVHSYS